MKLKIMRCKVLFYIIISVIFSDTKIRNNWLPSILFWIIVKLRKYPSSSKDVTEEIGVQSIKCHRIQLMLWDG